METDENMFEGGFGTPGPQDIANGAAALAAGLVREAQALAQSAAALRAAMAPGPEGAGDVRRIRLAIHAGGEAAMRAALALDAAALVVAAKPADDIASTLAESAKRAGAAPGIIAPLLRAAALDFSTDDAAARMAASALVAALCAALDRAG
jgi:hypothetical protein